MPAEPRIVRLLASVTDAAEAHLAVSLGAGIIDAKDPLRGALGALPHGTVARIVEAVGGRVPVSATVGDLEVSAAVLAPAVSAMAAMGVDFVKIGFFPGSDARAAIRALGDLDLGPVRLVGLLIADRNPDLTLAADMAQAGFAGIMLDTAGKGAGALPDFVSRARLADFISQAHACGLFAGLAGSLRLRHVAPLMALRPDILGFRGALCADGERTSRIEASALGSIQAAMEAARRQTGTLEEVSSA